MVQRSNETIASIIQFIPKTTFVQLVHIDVKLKIRKLKEINVSEINVCKYMGIVFMEKNNFICSQFVHKKVTKMQ